MGSTVQNGFSVAIALLAVAIAWGQWWPARQRLILDLFERRFQVFLDFRRVASQAIQLGRIENPASVNEIIARARFLFGADVMQALAQWQQATTILEVTTVAATAADSDRRNRYEVRKLEAVQEINRLFDETLPLFGRYMHMDQKPPKWPSFRIARQWRAQALALTQKKWRARNRP
jgi:hypothetical protein